MRRFITKRNSIFFSTIECTNWKNKNGMFRFADTVKLFPHFGCTLIWNRCVFALLWLHRSGSVFPSLSGVMDVLITGSHLTDFHITKLPKLLTLNYDFCWIMYKYLHFDQCAHAFKIIGKYWERYLDRYVQKSSFFCLS